MSKDQAKQVIQDLVKKYEAVKSSHSISKYSEEETKKGFIEPLFEALGWDIRNKNEVSAEESLSSGRPDYGFYLDGRLKFYLEAKPLKSDLHSPSLADQAVRYSWNKGATWAILTDFESLKVFNAQIINRSLADKMYFEIFYNQYLDRFEQLWLLSKESFRENLLDKDAEEHGKKLQKISVTTKLYEDLNKCREILTHDLAQWNKEVDEDLLDEGVQKLLDRLIFLRVAEDRGIERPTLMPLIRDWENKGGKLYESMIHKFREFDEIYNSNLFSPHPFEGWGEYSGATQKAINILYGKPGYYEYDFKVMPVDILGSVYENYLGYRLEKSKKGLSVSKDAKKRKEHGIYYTPTYIVDYIVKNTLKPILDNCKSTEDLKKIKVLDPACGSGSFLIKALELISQKYKEFDPRGKYYSKMSVLINNIYGVDLDPQAVELTKLNLLLNVLSNRARLPLLDNNIKNGNSLISGTDKELTKYFGKNFSDKKPLNWREEFPEIFRQGGFDVIIGNPPWVSMSGKFKGGDFSKNEIDFLINKYKSNTYAPNLYEMFLYRGIDLLKKGGYFSFIVPDRLSSNQQFFKLRKSILENFTLRHLLFDVEFPGIIADTMIFVLQKTPPKQGEIVEIGNHRNQVSSKILQEVFGNQEDKSFFYIDQKIFHLFEKIFTNPSTKLLSQVAKSTSGCGAKTSEIHSNKQSEKEIRIIKGENIGRFLVSGFYWFNFIDKNLTGRTRDESKLSAKNKILLRKTGSDIIASFDDSGIYPEQSLYFIYGVDKKKLHFLLALLNSRLINTYYKNFAITNRSSTPQLKNIHLNKFPVIEGSFTQRKIITNLSEKMVFLNSQLIKLETNSEKWKSIKSEIEKTDRKIDKEIYKLYGLTQKEIKILEQL